ncbi:MAG: STAS domain-containing protein [Bacteroidota bacterium]
MNEQFSVERNERYTVISLSAEKLDTLVAPALKSELVMLNADGVRNLIIDLGSARYCDSSGLSAILVANRLCKNADGILVLTNLQESVRKLINISQLDSILQIVPDVETAAQQFEVA